MWTLCNAEINVSIAQLVRMNKNRVNFFARRALGAVGKDTEACQVFSMLQGIWRGQRLFSLKDNRQKTVFPRRT